MNINKYMDKIVLNLILVFFASMWRRKQLLLIAWYFKVSNHQSKSTEKSTIHILQCYRITEPNLDRIMLRKKLAYSKLNPLRAGNYVMVL